MFYFVRNNGSSYFVISFGSTVEKRKSAGIVFKKGNVRELWTPLVSSLQAQLVLLRFFQNCITLSKSIFAFKLKTLGVLNWRNREMPRILVYLPSHWFYSSKWIKVSKLQFPIIKPAFNNSEILNILRYFSEEFVKTVSCKLNYLHV